MEPLENMGLMGQSSARRPSAITDIFMLHCSNYAPHSSKILKTQLFLKFLFYVQKMHPIGIKQVSGLWLTYGDEFAYRLGWLCLHPGAVWLTARVRG